MSFFISILSFIIFFVITVLVGIFVVGPEWDNLKFILGLWIIGFLLFNVSLLDNHIDSISGEIMRSSSAGIIFGSIVYIFITVFKRSF